MISDETIESCKQDAIEDARLEQLACCTICGQYADTIKATEFPRWICESCGNGY